MKYFNLKSKTRLVVLIYASFHLILYHEKNVLYLKTTLREPRKYCRSELITMYVKLGMDGKTECRI